jgi:hypothetical protein
MNAAEIRTDLLNKIETMNIAQLKEFYGLLHNYFNSSADEEWNNLTAPQKAKIEKGIAQADAGITKPIQEVTSRLRHKYGLNG